MTAVAALCVDRHVDGAVGQPSAGHGWPAPTRRPPAALYLRLDV
jgi:hypothetical protein